MATIGHDHGGRKRILFVALDGKRKTIRLGKISSKQAESFKVKVEALVGGAITGALDDEVSRWLADRDDGIYGRLVAVGLTKPRTPARTALGTFIDEFLEGRPDLKPQTVENLKQLRRWIVGFFGENLEIRLITANDAECFRAHMVKGGLGENTIRRKIGRSRQIFKAAIRRGLYRGNNPFDGMAATVRADKARQFFIDRDTTWKVMDACPNTAWKLIMALSRFGGLRCPSETLALTWGDVNFENGRIRVPSCKTEHHEGKGERIIPMFPELRPLLEQALGEQVICDEASKLDYVISGYRGGAVNLRTHFQRIIRKAGLTPWPKLFHNLRASRQTELARDHPIHVVCDWLGNSRAVAQEYYLQLRDSDFERAIQGGEKTAQYPAQHTAEPCRTESHHPQLVPSFPTDSAPCDSVQYNDYPHQDSNLRPPV
jgi:integrase